MPRSASPTIALVVNTAWNIVNFRRNLIHALTERGYTVLAMAPEDEFVSQIESAGARFIALKQLSRKGTNPLQDMRLMAELRQLYKKEKVDIALHYTIKPNIYGTLAANMAGVRSLCTVTGLGYTFLSKGIASKAARQLYKYAFRKTDMVWFQNADDQKLFLKNGWSSPERTGLVPGSGIDTDFFHPRYNSPRKEDRFRFLFIGRLLYDKGIRELLQAFDLLSQSHPEVDLHIIGAYDTGNPSGLSQATFEKYLEKHPQVRYLGTTEDVRSHLATADAVVLPSYREGLPRVLLEGMSMAKPLIATDVPGCRETVIPGKNGFIAPVKEAQGLCLAMQQLIDLPKEEREEMAHNSRQLALDRFDQRIVIQRYLDWVEKQTAEL